MSQNAVRENFAWLVDGKVPASQLPSYVDDVLEYDSKNDFPKPGETDKIYVDKSTNLTTKDEAITLKHTLIESTPFVVTGALVK